MDDMNLIELVEQFADEDKCRAHLAELRWPDGVHCVKCESTRVNGPSKRHLYECSDCGHQFSVKAGTIFHDSHLPLWKWFVAVYLMCESKKGMSANQLKRTLGVSYKTAWYLCHRIRATMKDEGAPLLSGTVEVDETYIGGKVRGRGRGYTGNKATVVGAIERGGKLRVRHVKSSDRETLHGFIGEVVHDDAEAIYTDQWAAYLGIADENTRHESVNHHAREWVRGQIHTNTVESAWSLFDRAVIGSYHKISHKHLPAYLDEFAFRFNNRSNPFMFRDTLLRLVESNNLTYAKLTA